MQEKNVPPIVGAPFGAIAVLAHRRSAGSAGASVSGVRGASATARRAAGGERTEPRTERVERRAPRGSTAATASPSVVQTAFFSCNRKLAPLQ